MAIPTDREPSRSTIRPIGLGLLLATTFRTFGRSPIFFLSLSAVHLVRLLPVVRHLGGPNPAVWLASLVPLAIDQILLGLLQAAVLDRALRLLERRDAPLIETIGPGLHRALPVLAVSLIQFLAVTLGFALLVVPGILVAAALLVAGPLCLRGLPPLRSLALSWTMTRGLRWKLAVTFLVLVLPYFVVRIGLSYLGLYHPGLRFGVYLVAALSVAMTALTTILTAVAYHTLRPVSERAELADVFG